MVVPRLSAKRSGTCSDLLWGGGGGWFFRGGGKPVMVRRTKRGRPNTSESTLSGQRDRIRGATPASKCRLAPLGGPLLSEQSWGFCADGWLAWLDGNKPSGRKQGTLGEYGLQRGTTDTPEDHTTG
ncbi:hypothetical protein GGTG_08782 [Gaeumannomyces tritici R3-111a-1]|uniref:Uncharacterized protein n=1 Tax=Gaeumannomyces tritici (strain R3-111a-1) TaxID=644352 RepID=J3P5J3_GAET3|nr:hypothetical protein GGTG_08782 [Gaeumannomyces tritici R3-111a-1]EJT74944.1 hypothetical protein GGTG_08782 [Gaeumannomyces tritici R3-111a-1]